MKIKNTFLNLIFILFFILLVNINIFSNEVENDKNAIYSTQIIISPQNKNKYKSIKLTPEIYKNLIGGINNLRLFDDKNNVVPYFVNNFILNLSAEEQNYSLILLKNFVKDGNYFQEFSVKNISETRDIIANEIIFETSKNNFTNKVHLYGSYDNKKWEFITQEILYKVASNENLKIKFPTEEKYKFYRAKIFNSDGDILFKNAELIHNIILKSQQNFIEKFEPHFSVNNKDKKTFVTISGLKNLKLHSITVVSKNMFSRPVSFGLTNKTLYNLKFADVNYSDMSIVFQNDFISKNDEQDLIIENFDDTPITIDKIIVEYLTDYLVFDGKSEKNIEPEYFTLTYGDIKNIEPPKYDILNYSDNILKQKIDELALGETTKKNAETPKKEKNYDWLMNLVITFIAITLGIILIMKMNKKTKNN